MNLDETLTQASSLIKKYEGLSLTPYKCPAGIASIGYGSTYGLDGKPITMASAPITKEMAQKLLNATICTLLRQMTPLLKRTDLKDNQQAALLSLTYNIGIGNFKNSTLLKKINDDSFRGDLAPYWLEWHKIAGKICQALLHRRKEEYAFYMGLSSL